ncbi:MAG: sugar phosphate isomerase/epimerase family protein [Dehalococcoidia bacterium]
MSGGNRQSAIGNGELGFQTLPASPLPIADSRLPSLALSTMWAQQQRFVGRFRDFVEIARDAGFQAIEVSHSTDEAGLRECLSCDVLPVVSLHAPTPLLHARGRANSDLNLAGCDDKERLAAVAAVRRTLDFAAGHGIGAIVVHLGSIDRGPLRQERRLRELYAAGAIESTEAAIVRTDAIAARRAAAPAHLAAARQSLAEIVEYAAPRGVTIGVETRLNYFEIPSADEAVSLLRDYAPEEAGYWHDTGHAEIWSRLGFLPHRRWFDVLGDRLIGAHLHDVRDLRDHRAPGNGTLDWSMISAALPQSAARTCEIDQHESEDSLAAAIDLLRSNGLGP